MSRKKTPRQMTANVQTLPPDEPEIQVQESLETDIVSSFKEFEEDGRVPFEVIETVREALFNESSMRSEWMRRLTDPRRDIAKECGYPEHINPEDYYRYYDRDPIANRVCEVFPKECWMLSPFVYETLELSKLTDFEKIYEELVYNLSSNGEDSFSNDPQVNYLWEMCCRLDIAMGIGHYGVTLIGINDGRKLSDPADYFRKGSIRPKKNRKLLFLQVFTEKNARIVKRETNRRSPRYGMPTVYELTFDSITASQNGEFINESEGVEKTTQLVHWTRIQHGADNVISNPLAGIPRQKPVFNNILNLYKLSGGSAEMYWGGALPGYSFETQPQVAGQRFKIDVDKMRQSAENLINSLQRYIVTQNMSVKSLAPTVCDPTPQIQAQIDLICIKLGIPKSIFMGSERGEASATQTLEVWNRRVSKRQRTFLTPFVINPLLDRLIALNVLPEPKNGYIVEWPAMETLNDLQKADIAFKKTQALTMWIQGDGESTVQAEDFMTYFLGLPEWEAAQLVKKSRQALEGDRLTNDPMNTSGNPNDPNQVGNPQNNGNPTNPNKGTPSRRGNLKNTTLGRRGVKSGG